MHLYFLHDFDIKIQNGKHTGLKAHNLQLRKTRKEECDIEYTVFGVKKHKLVYAEQLKYFNF